LCLENLLLEGSTSDGSSNLVLVDFGIALRVPYIDDSNYGGISDVSEGTSRLLIKAQGQGGSLAYMDPVILEREEAFDGFAADLWSAGVLLFVFLTGSTPFKWPSLTDHSYRQINRGRLRDLVVAASGSGAGSEASIVSDLACDLLQNMLWRDPRKRLTMAGVLQHPWVVGDEQETEMEDDNDVDRDPARGVNAKLLYSMESLQTNVVYPSPFSTAEMDHAVTRTLLD
jgi:serine/threonine protein kinase